MTRLSDRSRVVILAIVRILAIVMLSLPLGAAAQHTGGSFGGGHWGGGGYHGGGGAHAPSARYRGGHSGGAHGGGGVLSSPMDPELQRGLLLVVAMSASTFWGAGLGLWAGASLDRLCRRALRRRQRRRRARALARRREEAR